jgi:hypothetical protein
MDPQSAFTFQDLLTFVISDMAKAISERSGETEQQHFARSRAAAHMILGFLPRDVIEAMLAGHCVMLHEVMTADVRSTLHVDPAAGRRRPRCNIVGLNRAFNDNLDRLESYRERPTEGSRDTPTAQQPAEPRPTPPDVQPEVAKPPPPRPVAQTLNRAARRQAARAENRATATASRAASKSAVATPQPAVQAFAPHPGPHRTSSTTTNAFGLPSPEAIAACNANPEAMQALRSGDPVGFARAMGIADPCEAFLAAANAKGSPFRPVGIRPRSSNERAIRPKR